MRRAASGILACGAVASAVATHAAPPGGQEPEPKALFPARSEVVTVDVVVLDGQGQPVKGLSRGDFVVKEDGVPRSLVGLQEVTPVAPTDER